MPMRVQFHDSVFVNCPFDKKYRSILDAVIFTITRLGFQVRIASENADSGVARIQKIYSLIRESKYGIHDLSRIVAGKSGELYRMNMPFELGVDIGLKLSERGNFKKKQHLILETEPYRYQAALSDLSNSDIKYHRNDAKLASKAVRDWFSEVTQAKTVPASKVWSSFEDFQAQFYLARKLDGYKKQEIYDMPIAEFLPYIKQWVQDNA